MLCSHSFSEWPKSNKEWKSNHHWEECLWGQTSMTIKEPGFKNYKKEWRDTCTMATFSHYERFDMQLYFSPFFFCYVPTVGAKCPLRRLKAMATLTEMYTITVTQITNTNTEDLSCGKHWAQSMLTVALCCIVFASFLLVFCCTLWPVSRLNCSEVLYCVVVPPSPTASSTRSSNKTISHSHTREIYLSCMAVLCQKCLWTARFVSIEKKELQGWEQTVWPGNSAQLFPCKY